jgi:hypothetical protein
MSCRPIGVHSSAFHPDLGEFVMAWWRCGTSPLGIAEPLVNEAVDHDSRVVRGDLIPEMK